jgi:hypothetical protein
MSTHDNENNARLKPEVLALLAEQAQAEGRTVDDLLDEAARRLIESRRDISELRSFVGRNRKKMQARGVKESDIASEIAADRQERRR